MHLSQGLGTLPANPAVEDRMRQIERPLAECYPHGLRGCRARIPAGGRGLVTINPPRFHVLGLHPDGRRLLVTHGDDCDSVTHFGGMQESLGDWLYYRILTGNKLLNRVRRRRRLGLRYWSLSEFFKRRSSAAERYIARFVDAGLGDARRRGLDGIVCGHIHRAGLVQRDGLIYANDGDWVESLTALTEDPDGTLRLLSHKGATLALVRPRL